jgi:hypothetical protein
MTTSNISLKLIPANVPSLCIPRVFSNIPRDRIFRIVDELGLGRIHGIDMVPKVSEKGEKYNRIFIHFTAWSTSKDAEKARQIALSGGEFKILYDDPYFWKVSASTSSIAPVAHVAATPKPANSRPKLAFDDTSEQGQKQHQEQEQQQEHQQKHQYPTPESRRKKYGPRPVTEQRISKPDRRQQDQRQATQSKDDNALANVNATSQLLDKLALDYLQSEPQDIKLTIRQLNSFYTDDVGLLPSVKRRAASKYSKKGPKVVTKPLALANPVALVIEVEEEECEVEEGEEIA